MTDQHLGPEKVEILVVRLAVSGMDFAGWVDIQYTVPGEPGVFEKCDLKPKASAYPSRAVNNPLLFQGGGNKAWKMQVDFTHQGLPVCGFYDPEDLKSADTLFPSHPD